MAWYKLGGLTDAVSGAKDAVASKLPGLGAVGHPTQDQLDEFSEAFSVPRKTLRAGTR
jgi:hypothetical protein